MKYRLSQIAAVVGGRFSGTDCEVQSVVTDSRSLTCELGSGPVFVAMCGANHDSHAFVAQMYARGVRAFMVERPLEALPECGYVVVENAIAALQCLAAYHRAQFRERWWHHRFERQDGHQGVDCRGTARGDEVLPFAQELQFAAGRAAVGADDRGRRAAGADRGGDFETREMARLERIIRPDVVVFTSIGDAHQENFLNLEQKCDEKDGSGPHVPRTSSTTAITSRWAAWSRRVSPSASSSMPPRSPRCPESVIGNAASRRNAQIVEAFCAAMHYPAPSFDRAPTVAMRLEVKEGINDSMLINDAYNLDLNSLALALDYLHSVALTAAVRSCCRTSRRAGFPTASFTAAWRGWSHGRASTS